MQAIVVGTDGTPKAHATVLRAGALALETGATLHVVAGYVSVRPTRRELSEVPADVRHVCGQRGELHELLAEAEADLRALGVTVRTWWAQETPSRLMRRVARRVDADVVVCGPELARINDRRRRWRAPRHALAARVAQHATWRVHDLTGPQPVRVAVARPVLLEAPQPGFADVGEPRMLATGRG